jgi:hypothetical protein
MSGNCQQCKAPYEDSLVLNSSTATAFMCPACTADVYDNQPDVGANEKAVFVYSKNAKNPGTYIHVFFPKYGQSYWRRTKGGVPGPWKARWVKDKNGNKVIGTFPSLNAFLTYVHDNEDHFDFKTITDKNLLKQLLDLPIPKAEKRIPKIMEFHFYHRDLRRVEAASNEVLTRKGKRYPAVDIIEGDIIEAFKVGEKDEIVEDKALWEKVARIERKY